MVFELFVLQLLWSFCYSQLKEAETRPIRLTHAVPGATKCLDYDCELTFEESGLPNTMVSVTWEWIKLNAWWWTVRIVHEDFWFARLFILNLETQSLECTHYSVYTRAREMLMNLNVYLFSNAFINWYAKRIWPKIIWSEILNSNVRKPSALRLKNSASLFLYSKEKSNNNKRKNFRFQKHQSP